MNTYSFRKDLLAVQEELLRFAYKLTADREEANDLLQETSLKALDNEDKFEPDTNFKAIMSFSHASLPFKSLSLRTCIIFRLSLLYPKGKVSEIQEKQFTTLGQNITALEIQNLATDHPIDIAFPYGPTVY